jgi:hypothetical protein
LTSIPYFINVDKAAHAMADSASGSLRIPRAPVAFVAP